MTTSADLSDSFAALADTFTALGDPMRWTILTRLSTQPASASTLGRELPISRQAVAKHLGVLHEAGLIAPERRGREVVYLPLGARLSALGSEMTRLGEAWERRLAGIKHTAEARAGRTSDSSTRHGG